MEAAETASAEMAATQEPGAPGGRPPAYPVWLLAQRVEDLQRAQGETRAAVQALDAKIDALDAKGEHRVEALEAKMEHRVDALEAKMDRRVDALEAKVDHRSDGLEAKIERQYTALDTKMDRLRGEPRWFIGVLLVAIIGLLVKVLLPGA